MTMKMSLNQSGIGWSVSMAIGDGDRDGAAEGRKC